MPIGSRGGLTRARRSGTARCTECGNSKTTEGERVSHATGPKIGRWTNVQRHRALLPVTSRWVFPPRGVGVRTQQGRRMKRIRFTEG